MLSATALVVVGMGIASWSHRPGEDDVRVRLVRRCEQVKARAAERGETREAAWGETTAGSANDCYARAIRGAVVMPRDLQLNWPTTGALSINEQPVSSERRAELRALWTPALAALSAGAHRCTATPAAIPDLSTVWRLQTLVAAEFICRFAEEDRLGAVHIWLDGATFALDQRRDAFGCRAELWCDEYLRSLQESEAQVLAKGLARIDERFPKVIDHEQLLAEYAAMTLANPFDGVSVRQGLAAWRSGFDVKREYLEFLEQYFQIAAVLSPAATDWQQREAQWRAYQKHVRTGRSEWGQYVYHMLEGAERRLRMDLVRLRLLRLAVAFHRGWPLPELADPFGPGMLEVRVDASVAAFQSACLSPRLERFASRK